MKTNVILVATGALGLIRKGINRYVEQIPGNIRVEELQKTVLLGTAHLLRRTLSMTYPQDHGLIPAYSKTEVRTL